MLNRRHLRVKVLQILYAYQQAENKDIKASEKSLLAHVDKVNESYIHILQLLSELANHEYTDVEERRSKRMPSEEDKVAIPHFATNKFIAQINSNTEFKEHVKQRKLNWNGEIDLIWELFKKLKNSEEYKQYCLLNDRTYEQEKEFAVFVFKKIISKSAKVDQYLEERNINWSVDKEVVFDMVNRTLKVFTEQSDASQALISLTPDWVEDKAFMIELFNKTIINNDEYQGYINAKTQNWDPERIAMMDTILMKMAVCELLNFSSIPVKVSFNEYIDISKQYSTPKSKVFINGILDKVLFDLKAQGKIKKTGRGLMQ